MNDQKSKRCLGKAYTSELEAQVAANDLKIEKRQTTLTTPRTPTTPTTFIVGVIKVLRR